MAGENDLDAIALGDGQQPCLHLKAIGDAVVVVVVIAMIARAGERDVHEQELPWLGTGSEIIGQPAILRRTVGQLIRFQSPEVL